jgi:competence protein ComEC
MEVAAKNATWIRLTNYRREMRAGTIRVETLTPRLRFKRSPSNNSSVVFRATLGPRRLLVTGDIENDAERLLAEEQPSKLRADILKVAHHGSRSSSSELFLDVTSPRVALISCGRENPFGHPHEQVLTALSSRGVRLWRTDRDGSIRVELSRGIRVDTER